MEVTSIALVSLACLLSSGNTSFQAAQDSLSQLTNEQVAVLEQIIESDVCLPQKFENAIEKANTVFAHSPTTDH